MRAVKGNETWAVVRVRYRQEKFDEPAKLIALGKQAVKVAACSSRLLDCSLDKVLLQNKNALIYGGGGFIDGAVARTFANLTSRTFLSYRILASMTTQRQEKAA